MGTRRGAEHVFREMSGNRIQQDGAPTSAGFGIITRVDQAMLGNKLARFSVREDILIDLVEVAL